MSSVKKTIQKLINRNISISVAESCTGGLISNTLVKNNGISKIFTVGVISYSNNSKVKYLNVSINKLKKYGAVSSNIAEEMINNLYKKENSKITISTTGIAGPNGGSKEKPIGLVFIGIKFNKKNYIFKKIFKENRMEIQRKTKNFVFKKIDNLV